MGLGDYQIYGPSHFEQWERDTGISIERGDILVIHTGYHRFYPSNWTAECGPIEPDETRYFIKHPGPTREFADWVKARGIRWLAVDAGSADHPMYTVIRQVRPDHAKTCAAALGRPLEVLRAVDLVVAQAHLLQVDDARWADEEIHWQLADAFGIGDEVIGRVEVRSDVQG
jgi:kynurenine formamidase